MTKLTLKSTLSPEIQAKLAAAGASLEIPSLQETAQADKELAPADQAPSPTKQKKPPAQMEKDWKGYLEKVKAVQAWLEETWPALFNLKAPKPLKKHIEQEILGHLGDKFSKIQLRRGLHAYTQRMTYLQAVLTADGRYGLNGEKVEGILDSEKDYSQQLLEAKEQKFQERRANQLKHKKRKLSRKAGGKAVDKEPAVGPSPQEG